MKTVKSAEGCERLYRIWGKIKERCNDPKHIGYKNYGAVGIRRCKEWDSFVTFRDWALNHGYAETLTIDRIDNSLGYSPDNCRWATYKVQARNRCTNVFVENSNITIAEFCEYYEIPRTNCCRWLSGGLSVLEIVEKQRRINCRKRGVKYTCLNQELTLVENLKFLPTTMSSLNAVNS